MTKQTCVCGSGKAVKSCCEPIINGHTIAITAEQLMRSRFTAYFMYNLNYIKSSWHMSTRPDNLSVADLECRKWKTLKIITCLQGSAKHQQGYVEFIAHFTHPITNKMSELHEISRFIKQDNVWLYIDGKIIERNKTKVARNLPCACGSGKKYKHCCIHKKSI